MCVGCGYVGCCDSSPNRHARAHAEAASHPVMTSAEPGEDWGYCYLDGTTMEAMPAEHRRAVARARQVEPSAM